MTRNELIELGYRIVNFEGTDEEHTKLLLLFDKNVPHPKGSTLFYYPENFNFRRDDRSQYNPTVEEVVDKAYHINQFSYDVDNLYIITPRYHKEILDPKYHYGYGY